MCAADSSLPVRALVLGAHLGTARQGVLPTTSPPPAPASASGTFYCVGPTFQSELSRQALSEGAGPRGRAARGRAGGRRRAEPEPGPERRPGRSGRPGATIGCRYAVPAAAPRPSPPRCGAQPAARRLHGGGGGSGGSNRCGGGGAARPPVAAAGSAAGPAQRPAGAMAAPRRAAGGEAGPAGSAGTAGSAGPGGQAIVWRNVVLMGLLHLGAVYALSLVPRAHILTLLWGECRAAPQVGRGAAGTSRFPRVRALFVAFVPEPPPLPRAAPGMPAPRRALGCCRNRRRSASGYVYQVFFS